MNDVTVIERPPLGIRLLQALGGERDWLAMTAEDLATFREAENRKRASRLARVITGFPDRRATVQWQEVTLPDRLLPVRVYRPSANGDADLPLVLHVHGGGFVGTAAQSDWVNSHLAARLPAVVVSVEHWLLAPGTALSAAVDDGWDVLRHVVRHAAQWGVDPARTAIVGESTGGLIAALAAIRAKESGLLLRAQVLVNPAVDLTETMFDHPSFIRHANTPTLNVEQLRLLHRLAVPPGTDPRPLSPLHADDLGGLAPALVVVPTLDPLADHGRRFAARLRESGTQARLAEHPGATHAFLSMPGVVPQAKAARAEITEFLRDRLAC
ncbi:Acetyl esterase/lipase [Actinokineospora alba]|uniref:Acetyl esterase/lipase n=1 Tax=Actinokineospora alba TaxID=504798 RepID=A0A1H0W499_9PSEU|nr:alpha/beta hydrolase [Actinokineospora alba]TDP67856.1 acetyl esterase/lipase [Actinokineospora alba]SDI73135.1 Acetyl esterase/lipase [Actinokineospora alba]SDP85550.1 Acetyl esterase/lipase [Actinokineospora alba]